MKTKISLKKVWVRTDAWRGYYQPLNAVAGANDTGSWPDSPCPSSVRKAELKMAADVLRAAGIHYKTVYERSSNVFCTHVYLVVAEEWVETGRALVNPLIDQCRLLYVP